MTNTEKIARLRMAIDCLEKADIWQQAALGDSDACRDGHDRIQALIDDFMYDIIELEAA